MTTGNTIVIPCLLAKVADDIGGYFFVCFLFCFVRLSVCSCLFVCLFFIASLTTMLDLLTSLQNFRNYVLM